MKRRLFLGLLLLAGLAIAARAQQGSVDQNPYSAVHYFSQKEPINPSASSDSAGSSQSSKAKASAGDPDKLSREFTIAALSAAFQMQSSERRIEQSIKRGFPLGEFWIENDLDQVDDSLRLAALNVRSDADLEALQRLQAQSSRLRLWTDWLIQANRNLQLAEYYISPSTLDNDDRFQNAVVCTQALVSMLSGRRLADDRSCQ